MGEICVCLRRSRWYLKNELEKEFVLDITKTETDTTRQKDLRIEKKFDCSSINRKF